MAGHLFVCKADITKLACDAWLLPTNSQLKVEPYWRCRSLDQLGVLAGDFSRVQVPSDFGGANLTATIADWPSPSDTPMPILTVIERHAEGELEGYDESVRQFVETFVSLKPKYLNFRVRPLIALPLVGTGKSGSVGLISQIIVSLLRLCTQLAREHDIDIALVLRSDIAYSVCQIERKRLGSELQCWNQLTAQQRRDSDVVAQQGRAGNLVLFIGAGISAGAGLPSWGELITGLAQSIGMSDARQEALAHYSFLDQAEILSREFEKNAQNLTEAIVKIIGSSDIYSLAHALISDWTTDEAVTQNYDTMYESACRDSSQPLSVIPYAFEASSSKWLLKMHGCISHPEDIVLSRSDYLDYDYSRSALSGIVQALLVTKHMLFLGFSLTDDHFIQLIFEVQKAVAGMASEDAQHRFGSVLTPLKSEFQQELWSRDLGFISAKDEGADLLEAINVHDVILDYITCQMHSSDAYILNDDFADILTEDEKVLKEHLLRTCEAIGTRHRTEATQHFFDYMAALGYTDRG